MVTSEGRLLQREELLRRVWPDTFVEEGNLSKGIHILRRTLGSAPDGGEYIQTVSKRGYRFVGEIRSSPAAAVPPNTPAASPSIAVLVLEDMSPEHDQEYFCQGVSEEIITRLMRVRGLRVASRTSSFRFRAGTDAREIGRQLGVHYLLEGSVRKSGERVRIVVQLVDAEEGFDLWSSRFDRRLEDIFAIQDEIAASVARTLELSLAAGRGAALSRPPTHDPEAYNLYLLGRYYWSRRPGEPVEKSLECFQAAIARDPDFALAYAGVADVYNTLGAWESGILPPAEALAKGKDAAGRALAIQPDLAEAHTALAYAALHYDCDTASANDLFERAIRLNPQYIHAHHWHSHCLLANGRVEESLAASRSALAIDPVDLLINVHLGWHYLMADQPAEAIEQCDRVLGLESAYAWAFCFKGWGLALNGDTALAVAANREAHRLNPTPVMLAALGYALAANHDRAPSLEVAAQLERLAAGRGMFSYEIGVIHAALGDPVRAFDWFRRAREERSGWSVYMDVDPRLKALRTR